MPDVVKDEEPSGRRVDVDVDFRIVIARNHCSLSWRHIAGGRQWNRGRTIEHHRAARVGLRPFAGAYRGLEIGGLSAGDQLYSSGRARYPLYSDIGCACDVCEV